MRRANRRRQMRRRNCIMATVCSRQDTKALAWFLLEDFHSAWLSFSFATCLFLPMLGRFPSRRSFLARFLSNVGLIDRTRFQTSSPSSVIRRAPPKSSDNPFQRFHGEHKSVNKSALSYLSLPGIRFVLPYLIQSNTGFHLVFSKKWVIKSFYRLKCPWITTSKVSWSKTWNKILYNPMLFVSSIFTQTF